MKQFELNRPNSCAECGENPGRTVFAKNFDQARAGQGICGNCANIVTKSAEPGSPGVTNDDLTALRGIGPKRVEELNALGIFTFAQLVEASREILAVQLNTSEDNVANWQAQAEQHAEQS